MNPPDDILYRGRVLLDVEAVDPDDPVINSRQKKGNHIVDSRLGKPIDSVCVRVRDAHNPAKYFGQNTTDKSGRVTIRCTNHVDLLAKKRKGLYPPGLEILFSYTGGLSIYQSLVVEGASPVWFLAADDSLWDVRFIRSAFPSPKRVSQAGSDLLKWFDGPKTSVAVLHGGPGTGKSSALGQFARELRERHIRKGKESLPNVFCHSFELDNSPLHFFEHLALWLGVDFAERRDAEGILHRLKDSPETIVILDGIDEVSDTGKDRGLRQHVINGIEDCALQKGSFRKHKLIVTMRSISALGVTQQVTQIRTSD